MAKSDKVSKKDAVKMAREMKYAIADYNTAIGHTKNVVEVFKANKDKKVITDYINGYEEQNGLEKGMYWKILDWFTQAMSELGNILCMTGINEINKKSTLDDLESVYDAFLEIDKDGERVIMRYIHDWFERQTKLIDEMD